MEQKSLGAWYAVVLKAREYSHARSVFGGRGTFPVPELGTQCVCCDKQTPHRRAFDPSGDGVRADPIDIPICKDCNLHVPRSTAAGGVVATALFAGVGAFVVALASKLWVLAIPAVVVIGFVILWLLQTRSRRQDLARDGHHIGLEISAINGLCSVRTTNPRLAREVEERNRPLVHDAG